MGRPCIDCRPQGGSSAEIAKSTGSSAGYGIFHYLYQKKAPRFLQLKSLLLADPI